MPRMGSLEAVLKHTAALRVVGPALVAAGAGLSIPYHNSVSGDFGRTRASRETLAFPEWAVPGLNRGPSDFQSLALPTELTARERTVFIKPARASVNGPRRAFSTERHQPSQKGHSPPATGLNMRATRTNAPATVARPQRITSAEIVPG